MIEQLNAIARLWWDWSVAMFWQVGLLILLIAALDRLTRRWAWPQLRYALWSLILIKLLPGFSNFILQIRSFPDKLLVAKQIL